MSMAITAAVTAVVSAGIAAYGASQQASAQKSALKYQQKIDNNNALVAGYERADVLERGEKAAQDVMRKRAQIVGQQRVAMSANGLDISQSGSALDLLATTEFYGQDDVNTIQSNAAREAWGYDVKEMNLDADSTLKKTQADNISPGGIGAMTGASSLLTSASAYASAKAGGAKDGGATSGSGTNLMKGKVSFNKL